MAAPTNIAVVAEKPSVARDIARVLGATKQGQGYLHGGGYVITWAIGHLVGVTSLRQLLLSPSEKPLGEIMTRSVIKVHTDTDQEEVAQLAARYNLLAIPVTDDANRLVGIVTLFKRGRRYELSLLLMPFVLNLAAAFLHAYPYGGTTRVMQHLAPTICLLAGIGLFATLERLRPSASLRWSRGIVLGLLLLGVVGIGETVVRGSKSPGDLKVKEFVDSLHGAHRCQVVHVTIAAREVPVNFRWYLATRLDTRFGSLPKPQPAGAEAAGAPRCIVFFDVERLPARQRELDTTLADYRRAGWSTEVSGGKVLIYGNARRVHQWRLLVARAQVD